MTAIFRSPIGLVLVIALIAALTLPFMINSEPITIPNNTANEEVWTNTDTAVSLKVLDPAKPAAEVGTYFVEGHQTYKKLFVELQQCDDKGMQLKIYGNIKSFVRDTLGNLNPMPCNPGNLKTFLQWVLNEYRATNGFATPAVKELLVKLMAQIIAGL